MFFFSFHFKYIDETTVGIYGARVTTTRRYGRTTLVSLYKRSINVPSRYSRVFIVYN